MAGCHGGGLVAGGVRLNPLAGHPLGFGYLCTSHPMLCDAFTPLRTLIPFEPPRNSTTYRHRPYFAEGRDSITGSNSATNRGKSLDENEVQNSRIVDSRSSPSSSSREAALRTSRLAPREFHFLLRTLNVGLNNRVSYSGIWILCDKSSLDGRSRGFI